MQQGHVNAVDFYLFALKKNALSDYGTCFNLFKLLNLNSDTKHFNSPIRLRDLISIASIFIQAIIKLLINRR